MVGSSSGSTGIRVFVHTAVDGYAWQGVPPAMAQSLQACLDAAGTFPGGSPGRGPQAAGGVIRCSVSGVGGTAVYRYHRRIAGDFRGRDSHYVALAFFPAESGTFDLRKVWNAPVMRAPADGSLDALFLQPGEWEATSPDFSSGADREPLRENRNFAVSGPDAPERISEAFQGGLYGAGALNCALFESADGALTGECVYEVFPEVAAEGKARAAFQAVHPYSVAAKRAALDDWKSAVDALEAKAKRLSSLPGMKNIADAARRAFDAAAASCSWMQRPASGGVSFEASPAGAHRGPSRPPARPGIRPRGGEGSRDPAPSPGRRSFPSLVLLFFASFLGVFVVVAVVAWLFLKGDEKKEGGGGLPSVVLKKQGDFTVDIGRQDDEKTGRQESAPLSPSGQEAAGEEDQGGGGLQTAVSPQGGESEEKAARKAEEEAARKAAAEKITRLKGEAAKLAQTVEPYRKWAGDGEFKSRFDNLDKEKSALDALFSASDLQAATNHFARIKSAADWIEKGAERKKQDKSQIEIWKEDIATSLESVSPFREKEEYKKLEHLFKRLDKSKERFHAAWQRIDRTAAQNEFETIDFLVNEIKKEIKKVSAVSVAKATQEGGGLPTAEGSAGHVDGTAAKSAKPETRNPNPAVAQKPAAPSSPAQPQKSAVSPPPQGGGGLQTAEPAGGLKTATPLPGSAPQKRGGDLQIAVSPSPAMVPPAKISQDEILALRDNAEKAVERKLGLGPLAPTRFDKAFFKEYGDLVQELRKDRDDADYSEPWLAYSTVTNECAPILAQLERVRTLIKEIREGDVPETYKDHYSTGLSQAEDVESFIRRGDSNRRERYLKTLSASVQNLEAVQKAIADVKDFEERRDALEEKIDAWEGGMLSRGELYGKAKEEGLRDPGAFKNQILSSDEFVKSKKWLKGAKGNGTVDGKRYSPKDCLARAEKLFSQAEELVAEKLEGAKGGAGASAPTATDGHRGRQTP